jgi:lipopolysaccharide/colanic/teichoic acid biosynthesis glycosyltransferase
MSDAPFSSTFSRPGDPRSRVATAARSGPTARQWPGRHRLRAIGSLASDLAIGSIAVTLATTIVNAAWHDPNGSFERLWTEIPAALLLLTGTSCCLGLYSPSTRSLIERFRLRAVATLIFVFASVPIWAYQGIWSGIAMAPLVGAIALVLASWREHVINARSAAWGASAAILGTGADSRSVARFFISQPIWGLRPTGFIDDGRSELETAGMPGEDELVSALPLLGSMENAHLSSVADVLIVPCTRELPHDRDALYRLGARQILIVSPVGTLAPLGVQVGHFDRFVGLEFGGRPSYPSETLKRAVDIALAVPLALIAAPIIGLLAVIIKIIDPGPALYGQQRLGRHGRPIQVLKLRTMYQNAEQKLEQVLANDAALRKHWERYFKLPKDPRILPHIGNFVRRTSLDELPQLWNVIRGDMSLVGPRPFPAYHMEAFELEFRALRLSVAPGLTGLWQVSSRSNGDLGLQRAQDSFYIRNRSLWLDFYILIITLPAVIAGRGAR